MAAPLPSLTDIGASADPTESDPPLVDRIDHLPANGLDTTESEGSIDYPLGGDVSEPSIDATSIGGEVGGGVRKEREEEVTEEEKAHALKLKSDANKLFSTSRYRECLDLYTLSLNQNPFDSAVWCNRAAVRLKLEEFGLAISDTTRAIELNPKYVKAYYRRALANLSILKPKAAVTDFKKVLALDPKNVSARQQYDATQKLIRRLEFEKAISSEDEELVSNKLRKQLKEGMEVESSYTGPILEQNGDIELNSPYPTTDKGVKVNRGKGVGARITKEFVEGMIEWFKNGKLIPKRYAWQIVLGAQEVLLGEESLVETTIKNGEKANVIGDTHGQYFDFMHLLTLTTPPSEKHTMVFNGDFVDRGSWSTEVVLVLFAYKWLYPTNVFLNRGNHETSDMNKVYGFEGETKKKYSEMTYKLFEETFAALPLATLVSASKPPSLLRKPLSLHKLPTLSPQGTKRYFIVHGGLFSKDGVTLDDIRTIDRIKKKQPGSEGLMCECLWTDPQFQPGRGPSKRGVGMCFGPDVTRQWTRENMVTAVIRSHEVRQEGYQVEHNALCITVFSAPNYVDQAGNLGGIVTIDDEGEITLESFKEQPHPKDIKPMQYAGGGFASMFGMM